MPIRINRYLHSYLKIIQPVRISDIWSTDQTATFLRELLIDESSFLLEDVKSWMWVPLVHKEKIISFVGIARKDDSKFSQRDADIATDNH